MPAPPCARAACFNEAPALRGGNQRDLIPRRPWAAASMRPPHCAGEIGGACGAGGRRPRRFNEAPALRGGNPPRTRWPISSPRGFNEAPALRGGNRAAAGGGANRRARFNEAPALRGGNRHIRFLPAQQCPLASMRPPHCAGEIGHPAHQPREGVGASMRPPHCAGEIPATTRSRRRWRRASMRPPHCAGEIPDSVLTCQPPSPLQ